MSAYLTALLVALQQRREQLLELDTRRAVYQAVEDYPGLHLRELARQTGLDVKHVEYHLRVLEKNELVSRIEEDGYLRYHPRTEGSAGAGTRDVLDRRDKRVLSLLRQPVPLHVTLLLLQDDERSFGELREDVGVAHGTLHYHVKRLERDGIVESRKEGRRRLLRLVERDRLHQLLLQYRPPDGLVEGFLEAWEAFELA